MTLYIYLTNAFYNIHVIRCFGNSVEAIFFIVLFYYYLELTGELDKSMLIFTVLMCFSLMIRCTSPLGWIPLLFYQVIKNRSLFSFIKAFLFAALPTLVLLTILDSLYYGTPTFVPYRFMYINLVENVSAKYGVSSPTYYFLVSIPSALNLGVAGFVCGIHSNAKEHFAKK